MTSHGTKFIWKIENFSFMTDVMLPSPSFRSHSVMWEVRITPTSHKGVKYIDIGLYTSHLPSRKYNCSLAFLHSNGSPLIWKQKKHKETYSIHYASSETYSVIFSEFIKRDEMFGSRQSAILPNNTLTVQCLIWLTPAELALPAKCFARTRIERNAEIVNTFKWVLENVNYQFERGATISQTRVAVMGSNGESVTMKLSLDNDDEFQVIFKAFLFRTNFKVKISILNVLEENIQFLNGECHFGEKEQEFTFKTNITKEMLMFHKNLLLPRGKLSLEFTCTVSGNITFHRMVNENEISVTNPQPIVPLSPISKPIKCSDQPESKQTNKSDQSDSISKALQEMYDKGFLSDCILKIGSREFPVHKAVLGVRSEVFKAMFTTDMKEKDKNCVDIQDVDGDTLQRLLRFVYSDSVDNQLGWENASKLYSAADKYALESLKKRCSEILESGLCLPSALHVLTLADMHQDHHLKSAALKFISHNNKKIIGTESWLKFEEENTKLVIETLRKLYLQKVDGEINGS